MNYQEIVIDGKIFSRMNNDIYTELPDSTLELREMSEYQQIKDSNKDVKNINTDK